MSNPLLPPEILDHIADLLHDEPETLKECCLVSKSWIPRTRKHIFANIWFDSEGHLRLWKNVFPDPSNSPICHARALTIGCTQVIRAAGAEVDGWIQPSSRITSLDLSGDLNQRPTDLESPLAPFYKFSPTLKSLRVHSNSLPYPELFTLIRSSPLLEDLTLSGHDDISLRNGGDHFGQQAVVPSTSPVLTGSLDLVIQGGMEYTARQLLGLSNGLHFRKLTFSWFQEEDLQWIMKLVTGCSDSIESLIIDRFGHPSSASLDLSKTTKLGDVAFWSASGRVEWITTALQTITPEHREFRQITVHVAYGLTLFNVGCNIRQAVGETIYKGWLDLDRLLVQLWESHSIRPKVMTATSGEKMRGTKYCIKRLLPEMTRRGLIDLT